MGNHTDSTNRALGKYSHSEDKTVHTSQVIAANNLHGSTEAKTYHHSDWENHTLSEGSPLAGISVVSMNAGESLRGCQHQQPAGCVGIHSH